MIAHNHCIYSFLCRINVVLHPTPKQFSCIIKILISSHMICICCKYLHLQVFTHIIVNKYTLLIFMFCLYFSNPINSRYKSIYMTSKSISIWNDRIGVECNISKIVSIYILTYSDNETGTPAE